MTKRIKALTGLFTALSFAAALPVAAANRYVGLDDEAVNRYYSHAARNISCSFGTHLNGSHAGVTEHFMHSGPLGYCGYLYGSTGTYHILRVTYYMRSGGGTTVPGNPAYNGTDPRATPWNDINSGAQRRVTDWVDQDRNGRLSQGDLVAYDGGARTPVERVGTAAELEDSTGE